MFKLRPYQREGVQWLLSGRVRGLAFDAGLGKTDTSLVAAKTKNKKIVVVCPASLRTWWQQKMVEYGLEGNVLSYYQAAISDWDAKNRVIICDEAQAIKNPQSRRHKIIRKKAQEAENIWLLSATPAPHSPADYYASLSLSRPLPPLSKWIRQYCRMIAGQYGDKVVGFLPGGRDRLREAVQEVWMRKTWSDCVDAVPPITFSYIPLGTEETVGIMQALQKEMPEILENISDLEEEESNLTRVRHLMGIEKARVVGPYLREKLDGDWSGERIVVYGEFLDTLNSLHAFIGTSRLCVHFRGDMSDAKKQAAVQIWKETPGAILFTQIRAGGTGLNLPEARVAMIAEGTWTAADWYQAACRLRRVDRPHPVLVECPYISETLDETIVKYVGKRAAMLEISL